MGGMQNRYNVMETDERMIRNLKWLLLTYVDTEDCGWKSLLKDLKKKAWKGEAKLQVITHHPLFRQPEGAKIGISILRGHSYKRIMK